MSVGAASAAVRYHVAMDTTISVEVPGVSSEATREAIDRAFRWFDEVERVCSRFDERSELRELCAKPGEPVVVSELLFAVLSFALQVAGESDGVFDPTVGAAMTRAGFDRNYRTGERVAAGEQGLATFRDVVLTPETRAVTMLRPLTLDLGAVAKGFAIDLAAKELENYANVAINAGGDLYLRGVDAQGGHWRIGVRDPHDFDSLAETFILDGRAICTSGDYERRDALLDEHHLLDPRTERTARACASATVIAPTAMVADALATAAFVLGPASGIAFLEEQGVEGMLITPAGKRFQTSALQEFIA
ncbi:MAG: FAD:protein FMN transferase [bacterium]